MLSAKVFGYYGTSLIINIIYFINMASKIYSGMGNTLNNCDRSPLKHRKPLKGYILHTEHS